MAENQVFNGKTLVMGPSENGLGSSEIDRTTNRNSKMIQTLLRGDVNGVFLFCIVKNDGRVGYEFLMPPGLSEEDSASFQKEFKMLFDQYALLVKK